LVAAVPLTTVLSAGLALNKSRLGKWEQALGPAGSGEVHHH
jgi:hypothetical protein